MYCRTRHPDDNPPEQAVRIEEQPFSRWARAPGQSECRMIGKTPIQSRSPQVSAHSWRHPAQENCWESPKRFLG